MYVIYWTTFMGQFHKVVPEDEVKPMMDTLDRLGFAVDKVEIKED